MYISHGIVVDWFAHGPMRSPVFPAGWWMVMRYFFMLPARSWRVMRYFFVSNASHVNLRTESAEEQGFVYVC